MEYFGTWKIVYNGISEKMYIEKDALPNQFGAILIRDLAEIMSECSVSEIKELLENISFSSSHVAIGLRDLIENGTNRETIIKAQNCKTSSAYIINMDTMEFILTNSKEDIGYCFSFKEIEEIGKDLVGKSEIPFGWTLTYYIKEGKGKVWKNTGGIKKVVSFDHLNYIR